MNRQMVEKQLKKGEQVMKHVENQIVDWLQKELFERNLKGFIIGVSGGVDSAVTSALCAKTGAPVIVLNMPIHQAPDQVDRSDEHIQWLKEKYINVSSHVVDLTSAFDSLAHTLPLDNKLALANSRSRLRMVALYAFANANGFLVAGTGNKVEDYGVGFFTKYGDGGVDLSPIADLTKTEVFALAKFLDIPKSIQQATPTDGLWEDNRTDEQQLGCSYEELEWALDYYDSNKKKARLTERQQKVLELYTNFHIGNKHKLELPPVCFVIK